MTFSELANFIWSVADLLRGDYKRADYGKIILPFTLLRRLECVLEPTKAKVFGGRPPARRLQARRLRQDYPALHPPAPLGVRARAH
ncbi:type I restriction-modification system subunit M N-terminal domain-containing protein [Acidiferrobacter sp. SPIII_3]|uniref:type I restriction-modification system subunit M N-terminal domain-containing protein n=1 Tax=Acidiferrobacter sp. SPIII_3 TaxID=1281578 RepID=UPI00143CC284|nr:type I restriction-modification system subunit M N-terminal domain-containing protein [Acidiferrobacter sp. SPIII_3]